MKAELQLVLHVRLVILAHLQVLGLPQPVRYVPLVNTLHKALHLVQTVPLVILLPQALHHHLLVSPVPPIISLLQMEYVHPAPLVKPLPQVHHLV